MRYLPLFLDLRGRLVVIVGGGAVALRKAELVAASGARLRFVATALSAPLLARLPVLHAEHIAASFAPGQLAGARLVIAATDDEAVNRAVAAAAEALAIPVNVVDDPGPSSAIFPAIVDRSPVLVAIGSSALAPALARHLRARIELAVDESFGRLAVLLGRFRARIRARLPGVAQRRQLYDRLLDGEVARLMRAGRETEAERALERALAGNPRSAGRVVIVGAGPGDPGLLTLKALRALETADVVLYDRLVADDILALARRDAERIDVGKCSAGRAARQEDINARMIAEAGSGRVVVRLKGGDPFIFGRGGEELEALAAAGIAYEVVPGVTAASACAAYAGIPLTHRSLASGVRFVTAHSSAALEATDWRALAAGKETLAVYMGVALLAVLERELIAHGRAASTPIAFVENGTRAEQRVLTGTLGETVALARAHVLRAPALLVIGEVAALAGTLGWFGADPLTLADAPASARGLAA
jgi:uroporphyrin-III C-methyltransferase / precorrin-2 dehydrogenase / sirohydrochlorin ferrochelatase